MNDDSLVIDAETQERIDAVGRQLRYFEDVRRQHELNIRRLERLKKHAEDDDDENLRAALEHITGPDAPNPTGVDFAASIDMQIARERQAVSQLRIAIDVNQEELDELQTEVKVSK